MHFSGRQLAAALVCTPSVLRVEIVLGLTLHIQNTICNFYKFHPLTLSNHLTFTFLSSSKLTMHAFLTPSTYHVQGLPLFLLLFTSDLYIFLVNCLLLVPSTCSNHFETFECTLSLIFSFTKTVRPTSTFPIYPSVS